MCFKKAWKEAKFYNEKMENIDTIQCNGNLC